MDFYYTRKEIHSIVNKTLCESVLAITLFSFPSATPPLTALQAMAFSHFLNTQFPLPCLSGGCHLLILQVEASVLLPRAAISDHLGQSWSSPIPLCPLYPFSQHLLLLHTIDRFGISCLFNLLITHFPQCKVCFIYSSVLKA